MAKDVQDVVRNVLRALEDAGDKAGGKSNNGGPGGLSGLKGVAAGAGAAALLPLAVKNAGKLTDALGLDSVQDLARSPKDVLKGATSHLGDQLGDKVSEKVDEAGGPSGILKDTVKGALPFGGGDSGGGGGKGGAPGVGKGRRMPVQQSVDIGAPLETVYNQWTQFEDWPNFMHRVTRVTQEDDCTVSFATKIWGKTKEFTAKIETQRPDQRVKWRVSQGMTHTGVVTFHELGPNLTRVLLGMDVEPGGLMEKAARGMRHVKRAARADLHRFKAFVEMNEQETGAWRGVIEDGELVEEHDPKYDRNREYADIEEITSENEQDDEDEQDDQDDDEQDEQDEQRGRGSRGRRSSAQSRSSSSRSSGGSSRSSGGSSRSSGGSSRSSSSGSSRSSSGSSRSSGGSGSGGRSGSGNRSGSRSRNSHNGGSSRGRSGSASTSSNRQSGRRQSRSRDGHGS